jgi:hypothetical protein
LKVLDPPVQRKTMKELQQGKVAGKIMGAADPLTSKQERFRNLQLWKI